MSEREFEPTTSRCIPHVNQLDYRHRGRLSDDFDAKRYKNIIFYYSRKTSSNSWKYLSIFYNIYHLIRDCESIRIQVHLRMKKKS